VALSEYYPTIEEYAIGGSVKLGAGDDNLQLTMRVDGLGRMVADGGSGVDTIGLSLGDQTDDIIFNIRKTKSLLDGRIKVTGFETVNITSGSGNDVLTGGANGDTMSGGEGNDKLYGGAGSDRLDAGAGVDKLYGGSGMDYLTGGSVTGARETGDVLDGGADNDVITMGLGATAIGGSGFDTLVLYLTSETGNFSLNIGKATQKLDAATKISGFEALQYYGSAGKDNVTGGEGVDILNGYNGNDTLVGRGGTDTLTDGAGNDKLYGGDGDDTLWRSDMTGKDVFDGGAGTDTLQFSGYYGSVILDLAKQSQNDGLAKGLTVKNIERVHGSFNEDRLSGDSKANYFNGGYGDDTLDGRAGNDTLDGGTGDDWLTGGAGNDMFILNRDGNQGDIITDFTRGSDKLGIQGYAFGIYAFEKPAFELVTGANPVAKTTGPTILFETDNGRLWFDPDGKGDVAEAEFIAQLRGVSTLTMNDFELF
jgi:Ca2+-binding RTX toxin-like protein